MDSEEKKLIEASEMLNRAVEASGMTTAALGEWAEGRDDVRTLHHGSVLDRQETDAPAPPSYDH